MIYKQGKDSIEGRNVIMMIILKTPFLTKHLNISRSFWKKFLLLRTDRNIDFISFLSDEEYQQIIYDRNRTESQYPGEKTIQALFEEQVEKTPTNKAIIFEGNHVTYSELNEKA